MGNSGDIGTAEQVFAAAVRLVREHAGLSQREVAARMQALGEDQFHQQTLARIESGDQSPRLHEMEALAHVLGTDMFSLLHPPGLTADARDLWRLAADVREARRERDRWARQFEAVSERLGALIRRVRARGNADTLAREIRQAELALNPIDVEAVTGDVPR